MLRHPFTREQIDSLCVQDKCAYARALLLLDGKDIFSGWDADCASPEAYASLRGTATSIIMRLGAGQGKSVWGDHYRIPRNAPLSYADKLYHATRHILTTNTFPAWLYPEEPVQEPAQEGLTWKQARDVLSDAELEAHARLIAAAPELAEALKLMILTHPSHNLLTQGVREGALVALQKAGVQL